MILYLNKIDTNAGWGAEVFLNHAFRNLGVEAINVDYQTNQYKVTQAIAPYAEVASATLVQRGVGYRIPSSVIKLLPQPRILLLTELVNRVQNQSYMWSSKLFDYFYVRTPLCKNHLVKRYGIAPDRIEVFLSAFDDSVFCPLDVEKDIDILFVGAMTERRKQVIAKLKVTFGDRLIVKSVFGKELNDCFNRSKVVLNIHGENFLDTETRIFEALGARSFVISEQLSEESPFEDKKDLVIAKSLPEMIELVQSYLDKSSDNIRQEIAGYGQKKVLNFHTYFCRGKQLISKYDQLRNQHARNSVLTKKYKYAACVEWGCFFWDKVTRPFIQGYHRVRTFKY